LRPPIARNGRQRAGNLDPLSIAYAFRPRLRPASPAADQHGCGTLGHSVGGLRTPLALLVPTFALPRAPAALPGSLRCVRDRLPTLPESRRPRLRRRSTGRCISGAATPSSRAPLRILVGVAAPVPPSWLALPRDGTSHRVRPRSR